MKRVLIPVLIVFVLLPLSVHAQTYYVDASRPDDSGDGLSEATAWKTIDKVNNWNFDPGDTILFKRGEHWREQLTVSSPGNATHPITFGAYGTGGLPIIDGSEELTIWTLYSGDIWYSDELSIYPRVVWLDGESYFEATNADSINSINRWHWDGTATRLYVYAASNPNTFYSISGVEAPTHGYALLCSNRPYIKLQNLHFKYGRLYSVYFSSGADQCEMEGIIVDGSGQYGALYLNGVDYCTIENCTIKGDNKAALNNAFGIYNGATSNTVRNCTIRNGSHAALQLKKAYNSVIEYNEIYSGYEFGRCIGLNHENGEGGGNIVRYNYFYNSQGDDTPYSQGANQFAGDGDEIYYNLFVGTHHWGIYIWSESDIYPTQNMKFYNNVIYGFRDQGIRVNLKTDSATGNVFKNNIIISNDPTNNYQVSFKFSQGPNRATFENNCIYSPDTSSTVEVGGIARTVAYMETNYPSNWANNVVSYPLFVDAPNGNFSLQSTSPCIDNGTYVGLVLDFEGNSVPQPPGGDPDIGAYEYQSGGGFCGDGNCDFPTENCTSCWDDCGCMSPQICCDGVCSLPACFNESDCGSDPCKIYTCNNPGTCSASCSSQDITSCVNNDSCCPAGCNEGNDNDCGGLGPVAWYHFDEGSENIAGDSSGNGNDGTINGAAWTSDSVSGYALEFDGSYVNISDSSTMDFNKSTGTIELWIKPVNLASGVYQLLVLDSDYEIEFNIQGDGDLFYYPYADQGTWNNYNLVTNPLTSGEWQHVAVTWEYSTKDVRIYVNGTEQTLATENVPTYWTTLASTGDWHIGGSHVKDQFFTGTIDEVRIYDRTLTQEEILNLYNNPGGEQIPGDLNNDGSVDILDLAIIAANFGKTSGYDPEADVVDNNEIDVFDVVFVASKFT